MAWIVSTYGNPCQISVPWILCHFNGGIPLSRRVLLLAPPNQVALVDKWDTTMASATPTSAMHLLIWSMETMLATFQMVLPWMPPAMPWITLKRFRLIHTHLVHRCPEPILWMTWATCPMARLWIGPAMRWTIRRTSNQILIPLVHHCLSLLMQPALATLWMARLWPMLETMQFRDDEMDDTAWPCHEQPYDFIDLSSNSCAYQLGRGGRFVQSKL